MTAAFGDTAGDTPTENLILEVHDDRLNLNDDSTYVIDFWATWCGPCRQFAPIFAQSAADNLDVTHVKVDVDENQELAAQFNVSSIPTLVFIRDNILLAQFAGAVNAARLQDLLDQTRRLDMQQVRDSLESNKP